MGITYKKSKAWVFIALTAVLLIVFVLNATTIVGNADVAAADPAPLNVPVAFAFACLALASAIAANVSAFLNPRSTLTMKIVSLFVIVLVAVIVIPFFVTLGLNMAVK